MRDYHWLLRRERAPKGGGGIYNSIISTYTRNYLTLRRSLISGNSATNGSQIANKDYYDDGLGHYYNGVTADNFNLFGSNGDAGVTGFTPGATDVPVSSVPVSAILGPLAANGGTTKTHALIMGSPALAKVTSGCPATDQRGMKRPQPKKTPCDIGSFQQK
jgi:hypothetical protein